MEIDYRFFVDFLFKNFNEPKEIKVLDFGCGDGKVVKEMRDKGFQFFGVENYYGDLIENQDFYKTDNDYIKIYNPPKEKIPFPDNYFEFIYSNQVFEHVFELNFVLSELYRVLKDGGIMVHHFPLREYFVEGHFRIPLIHKFQSCKYRENITLFFIKLGFGINKGNLTHNEYIKMVWEFIDNKTCYRYEKEITEAFSKFFDIKRIDKNKLLYHIENKKTIIRYLKFPIMILPNSIVNTIEKRRGSITILAIKK